MPNGGPDCCGKCYHNPNGGFCELRDVMIVDKMWTYCANYTHSEKANLKIKGPIFSTGLYEGYVRLPWLGDRRPKSNRQVQCYECGDYVESGIEIELRTGEKFGFCCNKNYFKWWADQTQGDEERASPDQKLEKLDGCPKDVGKPVSAFSVKKPTNT